MTTTDPAVETWTATVHDAAERLHAGRHRGQYAEHIDRIRANGTRDVPRHVTPDLTRAAAIGLLEDYLGDQQVSELGTARALRAARKKATGDPRALRQLDDAAVVLGLEEQR